MSEPRQELGRGLRSAVSAMVLSAGFALFALTQTMVAAAGEPESTVNEKFADLEPAIQMFRSEMGHDRREIVKKNMLLTPSESAVFWPLYDKYRAEMHEQGDRRVRLITDFAASRDAMSEQEAARITK